MDSTDDPTTSPTGDPAGRSRPNWANRVVQFITLATVYRLLVGSGDPAEWAVGLAASAVATFFTSMVALELPAWSIRPAWLLKVAAELPRMTVEGFRVTAAGLRPRVPLGVFEVVPFDPGGDDPESTGRRAMGIALASLAPNSIAVTLDRDNRAVLMHRLIPEPPAGREADAQWPR